MMFPITLGRMTAALALFAASCLVGAPAWAQFGSGAAAQRIAPAIAASTRDPAPGKSFSVAISMDPKPGWHGYWVNPGDSGKPAEVTWTAPAGTTAAPIRHPAPSTIESAGFISYVHAGPFVLLTRLTLPASLPMGSKVHLVANVEWLACSDTLCVPEKASLPLDLTIGTGAPDEANAALFASARDALPKRVASVGTYRVGKDAIAITLPLPNTVGTSARLYPSTTDFFPASARQISARTANGLQFTVPTGEGKPLGKFSGVVVADGQSYAVEATSKNQTTAVAEPPLAADSDEALPEVNSPPARSGEAEGPAQSDDQSDRPAVAQGVMVTLLFALLGGLLLNLMPCVFPILSLKALSLARSGESAAKARSDALAYAAGTITVCVALGVLLLVLRAGGSEVGWSFQLQDPRVVLGLMLLMIAMTLNLAGVFEMSAPSINGVNSPERGMGGSFLTGVLSAIIATPCSGPFMAGALGAALVLPPAAAIAVFAGLGLGMALPFLAIGFVPALRDRLPRPGRWMVTFRHVLVIPTLATAVGLAWVLGRQTSTDGMAMGLAAAASLGVALWWYGHRQRSPAGARWAILAPAAFAALALVVDLPVARLQAATPVALTAKRQPFSAERLAALRAQGTPVFLDFTADWCLSCKVNERVAIDTDKVRAAFKDAGVVTMTGDWTRGDSEITAFLAAHGRSSIPFYLFYPPGGEPVTLPQILTSGTLAALAGNEHQAKPLAGVS
jgi:thiol:disulfide interchange protein